MKSYTDLSQSKKLAKILPLESADMYWLNRHIDLTETKYEVFVIDKSNKYVDFFKSYAVAIDNNEIIPCWSLAALLGVLPDYTLQTNTDGTVFVVCDSKKPMISDAYENPIDACYELILKLHERKML